MVKLLCVFLLNSFFVFFLMLSHCLVHFVFLLFFSRFGSVHLAVWFPGLISCFLMFDNAICFWIVAPLRDFPGANLTLPYLTTASILWCGSDALLFPASRRTSPALWWHATPAQDSIMSTGPQLASSGLCLSRTALGPTSLYITWLPTPNGHTCIMTVDRSLKASHFIPVLKPPSAKETSEHMVNPV